MLLAFWSYYSILIVSSLFQLVPESNAEETNEFSMICFHVKYGIIWCLKFGEESVDHWVSFFDETIDDETATKTLFDFLKGPTTENLRQQFSLTCFEKKIDDEATKLCSCRNSAHLSSSDSGMLLTLGTENLESSKLIRSSASEEEIHFIFVGSVKNDIILTHQLEARQCHVSRSTSQGEISQCVMDIMRQRYQQGYYRSGHSPPRSTNKRTGNTQRTAFLQQKKTMRSYSGPNGKRFSEVTTTTRGSPNGERQTQVVRRTNSRSPQQRSRSRSRSRSPHRSPQRGGGVKVPPQKKIEYAMDYPESPPTRDRPMTAKQHLQPKNNNVSRWNEDRLPVDNTPPPNRAKLSEPVDPDDVRKALQGLVRKESRHGA